MICPNCSEKIEDGAPFCYFCGEPLTENVGAEKWQEFDDIELKQRIERDKELKRKFNTMILTTTHNIEGYRIDKYYGTVFGEEVLGTGMFSEAEANVADFFGSSSKDFNYKLRRARDNAMDALKLNAFGMGANAVVGINVNVNVNLQNMFIVSACGTAVNIVSSVD